MIRKVVSLALIVLSSLSLTACFQKVPAGHVGVKVYLLGTNKGVDHEVVGVGRYWIGINEDLYLFPTYTVNYVWTKDPAEGSPNDESITFQTKEGLDVNTDIGISYHIDPKKVSLVFQKYHKGIDEITDIYLRNMVRDAFVKAASKRSIESVYGEGKTALIQEVQNMVANQVRGIGIIIEKIYWIGKLRLPPQIVQSINAKIAATQKAQQRANEVAQAKAEAEKRRVRAKGEADAKLIAAEAEARANKIIASSITPELIKFYQVQKWNGQMPRYLCGKDSSFSILMQENK